MIIYCHHNNLNPTTKYAELRLNPEKKSIFLLGSDECNTLEEIVQKIYDQELGAVFFDYDLRMHYNSEKLWKLIQELQKQGIESYAYGSCGEKKYSRLIERKNQIPVSELENTVRETLEKKQSTEDTLVNQDVKTNPNEEGSAN